MSRKKLILGSTLLVLFTLVASMPFVHPPEGPDKGLHALIFFLYTIMLYEWYKQWKGPARLWLPLLGIGLFLTIVGALYEEMQFFFIPGRTADPADWLADVAGILVAFGYFALAGRKCRL